MASKRSFGDPGQGYETEIPDTALAPIRVLLVEGAERPRMAMGNDLRGFGCVVDLAEDAAEALKFMRRYRYDLVLVNVRLPGMDGMSLLATSRIHHPGVPVVLLSEEVDVELAVRGYRLGAADLLEQPVASDTLEEAIIKVLGYCPLSSRGRRISSA